MRTNEREKERMKERKKARCYYKPKYMHYYRIYVAVVGMRSIFIQLYWCILLLFFIKIDTCERYFRRWCDSYVYFIFALSAFLLFISYHCLEFFIRSQKCLRHMLNKCECNKADYIICTWPYVTQSLIFIIVIQVVISETIFGGKQMKRPNHTISPYTNTLSNTICNYN